jgi:EmrB/QacA subfamily drug resistance transporter
MSTTHEVPAPTTRTIRAAPTWSLLAVLLSGQFMALLDVTIVNVAMPSIRTDLHASGGALQLIVSGYTVSYAMLLITGARLGDLYGRRRLFLAGVLGFTLSSLVCGLAPNVITLIVARFVQGGGAALMMPQVISSIQTGFTGRARAKALSLYSAVLAVGGVTGMVVGGALVSANLFDSGWRPVFLVNVPIGLVVATLVPRLMPADAARGKRRLDLVGLAIAVPAVFLVVLPLVLGHQDGWPAWTFLSLAAGIVLAIGFVVVEWRIARRGGDPLLNLGVLRVPGMGSGLITLSAGMVAYGGFLFSLGLELQGGLGDSALHAGLTIAPGGAAFGLCGFYWRKLPARVHHLLTTAGFVIGGGGYLTVGLALGNGGTGGAALQIGLLMFGVGMGIAFSPLMTHILVHVPPSSAADASGLVTTTLQLGQVVGVAVFGSIFLTLAGQVGPAPSANAIGTTLGWLAALVAVGAVVSLVLARTVRRAPN